MYASEATPGRRVTWFKTGHGSTQRQVQAEIIGLSKTRLWARIKFKCRFTGRDLKSTVSLESLERERAQ